MERLRQQPHCMWPTMEEEEEVELAQEQQLEQEREQLQEL